MNPKVDDARQLAKRAGLVKVIIFFETDSGEFGYASYGKNKQECCKARRWADKVFESTTARDLHDD